MRERLFVTAVDFFTTRKARQHEIPYDSETGNETLRVLEWFKCFVLFSQVQSLAGIGGKAGLDDRVWVEK